MKLRYQGCFLVVTKEDGDPRFTSGGYKSSAESWFLHRVKLELQKLGMDVIKKRMWRDGHFLGDETNQYIRTRNAKSPLPHVYIYNGSYASFDAGERFNERGKVFLHMEFDIFNRGDRMAQEYLFRQMVNGGAE